MAKGGGKRSHSVGEDSESNKTKQNKTDDTQTATEEVEMADTQVPNPNTNNPNEGPDFDTIINTNDTPSIINMKVKDILDLQLRCIEKSTVNNKMTKAVNTLFKVTIESIRSKLESKDKEIEDLKEILSNQPKREPSYSEITKKSIAHSQPPRPSPSKQEEDVIVIRPGDAKAVREMESYAKKLICSSSQNHKVFSVRSTNNVVIIKKPKCTDTTDRLLKEMNDDDGFRTKASAYRPKTVLPTIVIKNILVGNDLSTLVSQITSKNDLLKDKKNEIEPIFPMKSDNSNFISYAFRVSADVHKIIFTGTNEGGMGGSIFIYDQIRKVRNKIFVKQCQNCYSFDHNTKKCEGACVCKHCGEKRAPGHTCPKNNERCTNCCQSDKHKANADHFPNTNTCPLYFAQSKRIHERTSYASQLITPSVASICQLSDV